MHILILLVGAVLFSILTYFHWGEPIAWVYGIVDAVDIIMLMASIGALEALGDVAECVVDVMD